jgi:hypothetical protein
MRSNLSHTLQTVAGDTHTPKSLCFMQTAKGLPASIPTKQKRPTSTTGETIISRAEENLRHFFAKGLGHFSDSDALSQCFDRDSRGLSATLEHLNMERRRSHGPQPSQ